MKLGHLLIHQDSLEYFGERRTDKSRSSKFQGVETPSQVTATFKSFAVLVLFKRDFQALFLWTAESVRWLLWDYEDQVQQTASSAQKTQDQEHPHPLHRR